MESLPGYVAAAKPVPRANRVPWYMSIAQTYAGIMLWFVFWQDVGPGGGSDAVCGALGSGLMPALIGVVIAALICHYLFYLVPGLLGMQTGLPLYVVGTSTYGVQGGLFMPGMLMGLLQFGWLAVNAFAVGKLLCLCFGMPDAVPSAGHAVIAIIWAAGAAFVGLKGIQYVARVATFLPLIPLVLLLWLLIATVGGVGKFSPDQTLPRVKIATKVDVKQGDAKAADAKADADKATDAKAGNDKAAVADTEKTATSGEAGKAKAQTKAEAQKMKQPLDAMGVILLMITYIVGFFATAGAAGTDIASNGRNASDVKLGGTVGIALATIFAGCIALTVIAGAYGNHMVSPDNQGKLNPVELLSDILAGGAKQSPLVNAILILLAISSFPPACFSAFIAANSFKTTMPNVNPFVSVGIGTLIAIVLAVTGVVGKVIWVFVLIGASFGPVCGAMMADYLLSGGKWAGPRAGFNLAGWISWIVGFAVGAFNLVASWVPAMDSLPRVPAAPVAAFVVGFVLYFVLAKAGLQSKSLPMPADWQKA